MVSLNIKSASTTPYMFSDNKAIAKPSLSHKVRVAVFCRGSGAPSIFCSTGLPLAQVKLSRHLATSIQQLTHQNLPLEPFNFLSQML